MKKISILIISCLALISCNQNKNATKPQVLSSGMLSGKNFYNSDTANALAGLHFENDSMMQPMYKVVFDTLFIWKYKLVNHSLYRYNVATNKLIAKDSIINLTDSLLELQRFMPDTDRKLTLKLASATNSKSNNPTKAREIKPACFVHSIPIDTAKKYIVFPRLSGHLLSFTKNGKAILTTITDNYNRSIAVIEWLALAKKPNKQIAIQSTLTETAGTIKITDNILVFTADKQDFIKTFLVEYATNGSISKLIGKAGNEAYIPAVYMPKNQ